MVVWAAMSIDPRSTRILTSALLVVANLVPLAMLRWGGWAPGDILIAYWLENVVVGVFGVVRIMTARAPYQGIPRGFLAGFFVVHFGVFTLVHGVFTVLIAAAIGLSSSVQSWIYVALGLLVSHAVSLVLGWFGGGERNRMTAVEAIRQPYERVVILHVVVLGSAFLLAWTFKSSLGTGGLDSSIHYRVLPVLLLVAIKTAVDLVSHLRAHRLVGAIAAPAPEALQG